MRIQKKSLPKDTDKQELLTKKELELVKSSIASRVSLYTPHRLKVYIRLARTLRNKYRDLVQKRLSKSNAKYFITIAKTKIFDRVLLKFEKQAKKMAPPIKPNGLQNIQKKSNPEQLYDLNGVTREEDDIKIPSKDVPSNEEQADWPKDFIDLK